MRSRHKVVLLLSLLVLPTLLVIANIPEILQKKPPKNFWRNLKKLKGGNPYARSIALSGTSLMIIAQIYSVVKRAGGTWTQRLGGLKFWLTIHTAFNLIGSALLLIHAGLLSKLKFFSLEWLLHSPRNLVAGITAILIPFMNISGIFGRYLYGRLPVMRRQFSHWRTFHIAMTAVFYAKIQHIL